jgi:excisionase family DNA binding protein
MARSRRDWWGLVVRGRHRHTPPAVQEGSEPLDLIGPLLPRLEALGMSDLAQRLAALSALDVPGPSSEVLPADLLTLAEAAEFLGLRSPNTVRSLVESGELEAYWHAGDQMVVPRHSAEAYLHSPHLVGQRRLEAQIWSALDDLF